MKRCQFVLANRAESVVESSLLVAFYWMSVCMLAARKCYYQCELHVQVRQKASSNIASIILLDKHISRYLQELAFKKLKSHFNVFFLQTDVRHICCTVLYRTKNSSVITR